MTKGIKNTFLNLWALTLLFSAIHSFLHASEEEYNDLFEGVKYFIKNSIQNISDTHYWALGKEIKIPLPVIVKGSKGFTGFLSDKFKDDNMGDSIFVKEKMTFIKHSDVIYELNEGSNHLEFIKDDYDHLVPLNGHRILDLSITRNFVLIFITLILLTATTSFGVIHIALFAISVLYFFLSRILVLYL